MEVAGEPEVIGSVQLYELSPRNGGRCLAPELDWHDLITGAVQHKHGHADVDGVAVVTEQKRQSTVTEWPELAVSWGFDGV